MLVRRQRMLGCKFPYSDTEAELLLRGVQAGGLLIEIADLDRVRAEGIGQQRAGGKAQDSA